MAKSNIEMFRAIIDRGFNNGDLSVADEVCAAKLIEHEFLSKTDIPGPEILKDQIADARAKNPGLHLVIEDMIESAGKVWARMQGTANVRGKDVSFSVIDICRFEDGLMVEHWGVPDRFAILHQIGALPPPK